MILGASALFPDSDYIQRVKMLKFLFYLNVTVFCAAMPYTTTLGIVNILRFQYVRGLEDYLAKKNRDSSFLRWMSFSSPVTTRNPLHINSPVTFFHFFCYNVATLSAILFCFGLAFAQYWQIPQKSQFDTFLFGFSIAIMAILSFLFIYTCLEADKIASFCCKNAIKKRNNRLNNSENHDFLTFIIYILYPRIKDFHKGFLIIIGYLMGLFMIPSELSLANIKNIVFTWFILEFLGYQARYQINDLRGISENQGNRLPVPWKFGLSSALIALIRFVSAFIFAVLFGKSSALPLVICLSVLLLVTCLYEYARIKNIDNPTQSRWCILILVLVSIGYPLRFLSGLWTAIPIFWSSTFCIANYELGNVGKFFILLALAFFGEFSVLFPWYYEANEQNNHNAIKKPYYSWLINHNAIPLREISFLISIIILFFLQLECSISISVFSFEIGILGCAILMCILRHSIIVPIAFTIIALWKNNYIFYTLREPTYPSFILFLQLFFIVIYALMTVIFGPKINFKKVFKVTSAYIFFALAGEKSLEWIKKNKK